MLNIFSMLGPSRAGKGAPMALISAIKSFELPYCNPDLDIYLEAYNCGEMSENTVCKLSMIYMLCYSWFGYLGRHINLRPNDYSSMQMMMPHIDVNQI